MVYNHLSLHTKIPNLLNTEVCLMQIRVVSIVQKMSSDNSVCAILAKVRQGTRTVLQDLLSLISIFNLTPRQRSPESQKYFEKLTLKELS